MRLMRLNQVRSRVPSAVFCRVFECVRLTREEGAQGKARRCNVPGYVCHRLAPGDGRWGRTAVQLHRNIEKTIMRHVWKHFLRILVSLRPSVMCIHSK